MNEFQIEKIEIIYRNRGDDPITDPLGIGDKNELHYCETVGVKITTSEGKRYGNWLANGCDKLFTGAEIVEAVNLLLESLSYCWKA